MTLLESWNLPRTPRTSLILQKVFLFRVFRVSVRWMDVGKPLSSDAKIKLPPLKTSHSRGRPGTNFSKAYTGFPPFHRCRVGSHPSFFRAPAISSASRWVRSLSAIRPIAFQSVSLATMPAFPSSSSVSCSSIASTIRCVL